MRNFDKHFDDFDRKMTRMRKWAIITSIIWISIILGLIGFGIWVIVILLRFFRVV